MVMIVSASVSTAFAGGPRMDWDDRYTNVPGAPECWVDGFDDSEVGAFSQSRNYECTDKGDQYYRGWLAGCTDAGNTRDDCEALTDSSSTDCPIIDGTGRGYDLVERGWCHGYMDLQHSLP
jgi:hypothetical protein